MRAGFIGAFFFIWVIALLLGSFSAGIDLFQEEDITNPAQDIMSYSELYTSENASSLALPWTHEPYFTSILSMISLNFPMFGDSGSPWQIVRWVILGPLIATVVFALIMLIISTLQKFIPGSS